MMVFKPLFLNSGKVPGPSGFQWSHLLETAIDTSSKGRDGVYIYILVVILTYVYLYVLLAHKIRSHPIPKQRIQ